MAKGFGITGATLFALGILGFYVIPAGNQARWIAVWITVVGVLILGVMFVVAVIKPRTDAAVDSFYKK